MKLYCKNCCKEYKIVIVPNSCHKAICSKCRKYIKMLSFDECQQYQKEKYPNKKSSNDRIAGIGEALLLW